MLSLLVQIDSGFDGRRGHMRGAHPGAIVVAALLVLALGVALALFLRKRKARGETATTSPTVSAAVHGETILSERFARGEISIEEFLEARAALRGEWVAKEAAAS